MAKVWAVTEGEYSDYQVLAVFSTKAAAEAWAENDNALDRRYGGLDVEEFDLDPPLRVKVDMWHVHGRVTVDGERADTKPLSMWGGELTYPNDRSTAANSQVRHHAEYVYDGVMYPEKVTVYVRGWDKERVARIYSDTMARLVAEAGHWAIRDA